jgi:hypothetical protein
MESSKLFSFLLEIGYQLEAKKWNQICYSFCLYKEGKSHKEVQSAE